MWNPVKDYPIASFIDGFNTVWGSLFLFAASCSSGYLLVAFEPKYYFDFAGFLLELTCGWFFMLIISTITGFGIPLALILFWTLYRLIYSDDSRVRLCYIAAATQSVACLSVFWIGDYYSGRSSIRVWIVLATLLAAFFVLRKLGLLRNDA
jgi:hypothetical protein